MTPPTKNIVFDIVGTCVPYDAFFAAIETRLGPQLRSHCINPRLFGFAWMETAEREFTYLDISGRYVPFWSVFQPPIPAHPLDVGNRFKTLGPSLPMRIPRFWSRVIAIYRRGRASKSVGRS